jgi:hypothetical protein
VTNIPNHHQNQLVSAKQIGARLGERMTTRTHFAHRIDMCDANGAVIEHLAGIEDFLLAMATYRAARQRWPDAAITLRQGERVIEDSRRPWIDP